MCNRCSKMFQEISRTCTREEEHRLLNTYATEVKVGCELCEPDMAPVQYPELAVPQHYPHIPRLPPAYLRHHGGAQAHPGPPLLHCAERGRLEREVWGES